MLTDRQIADLQRPLDPARVKQRRQGDRLVPYLEGYDVIDRTNAVFGFDGWSYAVGEVTFTERNGAAWYQATVTVRAAGVERADAGFCDVATPRGGGLAAAGPEAHGSALKGAITDGLKRALRTFGNQFGNSLYEHDRQAEAAGSPEPPAGPSQQGGDAAEERACPQCGAAMALRSGTTRDARSYTAWFCTAKCGQRPIWLN